MQYPLRPPWRPYGIDQADEVSKCLLHIHFFPWQLMHIALEYHNLLEVMLLHQSLCTISLGSWVLRIDMHIPGICQL